MINNKPTIYRGRFAPSPTGPVHFGTLVAAAGSYLQAKTNNGEWIVRMEDVDTTRTVEGADTNILNTLETFAFQWQGEVLFQTEQTKHYQHALDKLISHSQVFPCLCSRKQLNQTLSDVYPGDCRSRQLPETQAHAIRLLANDVSIEFKDAVMGEQKQNIKDQCGDFVIKRRDDLFAYQLAVVVDDAMQSITEVVRGADLLDSTPRQIYLQQLLGFSTPRYCHLPLAVDKNGNKVSKSEGGFAIDVKHKEQLLIKALAFLGQSPPDDLSGSNIDDIWRWAVDNWDISQIPVIETVISYE